MGERGGMVDFWQRSYDACDDSSSLSCFVELQPLDLSFATSKSATNLCATPSAVL